MWISWLKREFSFAQLFTINLLPIEVMKRQYDFSKAVRGKFYRKEAELRLPIYLNAKLQSRLERIAKKKGKDIGDMVNSLVRKEIKFIEESI